MKTKIKEVYKYMLDNCKYYTVTTTENTYYNVLILNYACCSGSSRLVYLTNINELEVFIISATIKNKDIQQIKEQEKFIYF